MVMYKIAQKKDLEKLITFLRSPDIDQSFVKPLSQRSQNIRDRVLSKYEKGKWLIAYEEKNIIGCCGLSNNEEDVEVTTFVVSPQSRGLGIGYTLLKKIVEIAIQEYSGKKVLLDTWEGSGVDGL